MLRKAAAVFSTSIVMSITTLPCFAAEGIDKVDIAGNRILMIVRRIGYWVILIKAVYDVIGSIKNRDMKELGQVILFYLILYAALFFIPFALKQVEGVF